jgi:hypothetical protein
LGHRLIDSLEERVNAMEMKLEIRNWKLETGNSKLEIRNWKLEKTSEEMATDFLVSDFQFRFSAFNDPMTR